MLIYAYLCLNFWSGNRFSNFSASKFPWSDWWFSAPRSSAIWRWSHTLKGNFEDFELFFTGIGTMHPIVVGNCKHRPSQTMYWLGMVDEWPVQSQCKVNAKSMQSQCKQSNAFAATIECNQMHFPKTIFSKKYIVKKLMNQMISTDVRRMWKWPSWSSQMDIIGAAAERRCKSGSRPPSTFRQVCRGPGAFCRLSLFIAIWYRYKLI